MEDACTVFEGIDRLPLTFASVIDRKSTCKSSKFVSYISNYRNGLTT